MIWLSINMYPADLLEQVKKILQYHKCLGVEAYPAGQEIKTFLAVEPALAREDKPVKADKREVPPAKERPRKKDNDTYSGLAGEVAHCRTCDLVEKRKRVSFDHEPSRVRLMLIGDYSLCYQEKEPVKGTVFGYEEDQMVDRMFKAINLKRDEAYVTNIIKCGVDETVQPRAKHVAACKIFVEREIELFSPEVICCMGMLPVMTLTSGGKALSRMRGAFVNYKSLSGKNIPLLPTYHPRYLLQNPEMKQATWMDLQLIARKLKIKIKR